MGASLALCSILIGCGGRGPLRLAVVLPLSGPEARCGLAIRRGVELAGDEARGAGGEADIELRIRDSGGDARRGAELLASLYEEGAVAAIGGVDPDEARGLASVAEEEHRVLLSPSPVSFTSLDGDSRQFFRLAPSSLQEASALVRFVAEALGLEEWVVAGGASPSGVARRAVVERVAAARRLTTIEAGTSGEIESLLGTLHASGARAVLVVADPPTVSRVAASLRRAGFDGSILATSAYALADPSHDLGTEPGVLFPLPALDPAGAEPSLERFAAEFRRRYGTEPDLCAANGYDGARLLAEAARRSGGSPTGVWKGLRGIRDFPGTRRSLQFDQHGEVLDFPRIHRFEGGVLVDYEERLAHERREIEYRIRELERRRLELLGRLPGGVDSGV